jgi:hypothetical protein
MVLRAIIRLKDLPKTAPDKRGGMDDEILF